MAVDVLQAIITKYLGPTDRRGSRVKATAYAGSVTLEWDDRENTDTNHRRAAEALMRKYGWDKFAKIYAGGLPDGSQVFVQVSTKGE